MEENITFTTKEEDLYWMLHEMADKVHKFLIGFLMIDRPFSTYKMLLKEEKETVNYFWFRVNESWLFMNYEPEEMFINGLI